MSVVTVTVNQWRIKSNAETGAREPVICVNRYKYAYEYTDYDYAEARFVDKRVWGPKIGETGHYHIYDVPAGHMVYDPVNKTPCGASCWMEYEE